MMMSTRNVARLSMLLCATASLSILLGGCGADMSAGAERQRDRSARTCRAFFSMVINAPPSQYTQIATQWQMYEATGLGKGQPAADDANAPMRLRDYADREHIRR